MSMKINNLEDCIGKPSEAGVATASFTTEGDTVEKLKLATEDYNKHLDKDANWYDTYAYKRSKPYRNKTWEASHSNRDGVEPTKIATPVEPPKDTNNRFHERLIRPPKNCVKQLKQMIQRQNKSGDPRHSSYNVHKALTDPQAIYCRQNRARLSVKSLAEICGVSETVVIRCVKGVTYKHLNDRYKPWK